MSTTVQVTVRISPRLVERADAERPFLSEEIGHDASRADVIRRALSLGLKMLGQKRRGAAPDDSADGVAAAE